MAVGNSSLTPISLAAPYSAGRPASAWVKVKTARSFDLVVLAVEWGSGRRQGWLSNLHVGARETHREGHVVHVRPELVVEIAFNEVQRSSQYPGGVTLRFARVKGYRPDKRAEEADTIDAARAHSSLSRDLHEHQLDTITTALSGVGAMNRGILKPVLSTIVLLIVVCR